eukprot:TRINITY_DN48470_c0_g1_i1.p1 TRINITY_DN48470_c0_g1~~TRINITY_DN48470_c0_g1_i1.p1  ORF type:complete len:352 (-),score=46.97 TRINITY_DN48470_c0_g1_i1:68-1036(-)
MASRTIVPALAWRLPLSVGSASIDLDSDDNATQEEIGSARGVLEEPPAAKRAKLSKRPNVAMCSTLKAAGCPPHLGLDLAAVAPRVLRELLGPALTQKTADVIKPSTHGRHMYAPLTEGGGSWLWLVRELLPPGASRFDALWNKHPRDLGKCRLFGREVEFKRYQQAFGADYEFSGQVARAAPLTAEAAPEVFFVKEALRGWLSQSGPELRDLHYGACLVNWYDGGGHSIGAHADTERGLVRQSPIFALSWGASRIFRISPKRRGEGRHVETELNDGDLIIMGGSCQRTHKHEVPRSKKHPGRRISLTFRCFESQQDVRVER